MLFFIISLVCSFRVRVFGKCLASSLYLTYTSIKFQQYRLSTLLFSILSPSPDFDHAWPIALRKGIQFTRNPYPSYNF